MAKAYLRQFRNYCGLGKLVRCGFPREKTTKAPVASVYTNCETAVALCSPIQIDPDGAMAGAIPGNVTLFGSAGMVTGSSLVWACWPTPRVPLEFGHRLVMVVISSVPQTLNPRRRGRGGSSRRRWWSLRRTRCGWRDCAGRRLAIAAADYFLGRIGQGHVVAVRSGSFLSGHDFTVCGKTLWTKGTALQAAEKLMFCVRARL
jgi:hypothetical protein